MNGDTARVEPADPGSPNDPWDSWESSYDLLRSAEETLEAFGEYKAAREVGDAAGRLRSEGQTREARERQRGREKVYGEDQENAQIAADLSYDPNRG